MLSAALERLGLIDVSTNRLKSGAIAQHYRRKDA
jgi:hypothetical protein